MRWMGHPRRGGRGGADANDVSRRPVAWDARGTAPQHTHTAPLGRAMYLFVFRTADGVVAGAVAATSPGVAVGDVKMH